MLAVSFPTPPPPPPPPPPALARKINNPAYCQHPEWQPTIGRRGQSVSLTSLIRVRQ